MRSHFNSRNTLFLLLANIVLLSGCVAAAIGAVTVTAIDIATDRRTTGTYIDDNAVELSIRKEILADEGLRQNAHISVTAINGVVLLTGQTPTEDQRTAVLTIARSFEETKQVINEIAIAGKAGLGSRSNDSALTAKVKTRLYQNLKLDANLVKVVTEDRTVYLMGLVKPTEADAAVEAARTVRGVRKVVKVFEYI